MSITIPPHSSAVHRAAIARYLYEFNSRWGSITGFSSLPALLREARSLAGRDIDSGAFLPDVPDEARAEWAAILMYLILLEQLGAVLRRKGTRPPKGGENRLMCALRLWAPEVKRTHADALRQLRNALSHDFGLTARDRNKKKPHHRMFALSPAGPLVALPKKRWNGEYGNQDDPGTGLKKSTGGPVRVNIRAVADLVESVVETVLANEGDLRLNLHPEVVQRRFGFSIV
jgi:hypothetical protein